MVSFAEATAISALDSHTYLANFPSEWCIGNGPSFPNTTSQNISTDPDSTSSTVPHGGFVTSCFLSAVALHFSTTHASLNQRHTITLHLTFLRRTSIGPARFSVRDVKLGRRTSTVHVSLTQGPDASAEPSVVGYLTQSNLDTEEGISLPTQWSLHPPPLPLKSTTRALREGKGGDDNWILSPPLHPKFRKAAQRVQFYVPRKGQLAPAMADEWICLRGEGERFTQESLGFVVDQFPQVVEIYPGTDPLPFSPAARSAAAVTGSKQEDKGTGKGKPNWYPTILLNLDVKKALPEGGVEWLFVRVRAKKIHNGRMDLEVVVLDEGGELVAVSNHVCLILSAERNMTRSTKGEGDGTGSSKL